MLIGICCLYWLSQKRMPEDGLVYDILTYAHIIVMFNVYQSLIDGHFPALNMTMNQKNA